MKTVAEFDKVYKEYSSYVYLLAKRFLVIGEEAEEIAQDVWLIFWEKMDEIERDKIRAWLSLVVKNRCLNWIKKNPHRIKQEINFDIAQEEINDLSDYAALINIILKAVDELPLKTRMVFKTTVFDGLSILESANKLGVSSSTVKNLKLFAIKTIREKVANRYLFWLNDFDSDRNRGSSVIMPLFSNVIFGSSF